MARGAVLEGMNTIKKDTVIRYIYYLVGICIGITLCIVGWLLLYSGYESWSNIFIHYNSHNLLEFIWQIIGAIACFFFAVMLFINDKYYRKYISVRIGAFFSCIIFALGGLFGMITGVIAIFIAITDPLSSDESIIGVFGILLGVSGLIALAAAFILFWRVRKTGWFKKELVENSG